MPGPYTRLEPRYSDPAEPAMNGIRRMPECAPSELIYGSAKA
jgi:hypothetical protein